MLRKDTVSINLRTRRRTLNCWETACLRSSESCWSSSSGVVRRLISTLVLGIDCSVVLDGSVSGEVSGWTGSFLVDSRGGSVERPSFSAGAIVSFDFSSVSPTSSSRDFIEARAFIEFVMVSTVDKVFNTSVACWLMVYLLSFHHIPTERLRWTKKGRCVVISSFPIRSRLLLIWDIQRVISNCHSNIIHTILITQRTYKLITCYLTIPILIHIMKEFLQ